MPFRHGTRWTLIALALTLATSVVRADVVAVVSAKSAVTTLSKSQLADIFLGRAVRFPSGVQATPIDQQEGSPTRDEFYATFTGKSPAQLKAHWSKIIFTGRGKPPRALSSSADIKKFLAQNPNAIAYIEPSAIDETVRVLLSQ